MRSKLITFSALAVGLLIVCMPLLAHHGTGTSYDMTKELTVAGTVTQFLWANPHVLIYVDVTDDQGKVVNWGGELNNPRFIARQGYTKGTVKPGDKVTLVGNPSKAGTTRIVIDKIVLPDGRTIKGPGSKPGSRPANGDNGPKYEQ
jgi:hypothetical protein